MATNIPPHNLRRGHRRGHLRHRGAAEGETAGDRRGAPADGDRDHHPRGAPAAPVPHRHRSRLPHRRRSSSAARASCRPTARAAARSPSASRTEIETSKKGDKQSIVVTEIPYQVNKKRLIENIAELVREKTIEGISDLRDESDRDGMRIVIELKRGEVPRGRPEQPLQAHAAADTFGIIMLAIVGGRPKVLNLLEFIEEFIEFRREVVRRRIEFELTQGRGARPHPRGPRDRPRSPRRGDHADPRVARRPAEARDGPDRRRSGCRSSRRRRSSRCSCSA